MDDATLRGSLRGLPELAARAEHLRIHVVRIDADGGNGPQDALRLRGDVQASTEDGDEHSHHVRRKIDSIVRGLHGLPSIRALVCGELFDCARH